MAFTAQQADQLSQAFSRVLAYCKNKIAQTYVFHNKNVALPYFVKMRTEKVGDFIKLFWANKTLDWLDEAGVKHTDVDKALAEYMAFSKDLSDLNKWYQLQKTSPDNKDAIAAVNHIDGLITKNLTAIAAEGEDLELYYTLRSGEDINHDDLLRKLKMIKPIAPPEDKTPGPQAPQQPAQPPRALKNYYKILHARRKYTEAEIAHDYAEYLAGRIWYGGKVYSAEEMKEAAAILTDKTKRAAYDAQLNAYFSQLYTLCTPQDREKNIPAINNLIGRLPSMGIGLETAIVPDVNLGFEATDENNLDIVKRLGNEKDWDTLTFLAKHFRDCFSLTQLAFMGADLTEKEMLTDPSAIVYEYARGNHTAQVDKMFEMLGPSHMLDLEAAEGFLVCGNAAAAEKMVDITHKANRGATHFAAGFAQGGYLDDPQKLEEFLASGSKAFSDYVVTHIAHVNFTGISAAQKAVQTNLKQHAQKADKIRQAVQAKAKAKAKQKTPVPGGDPQGADPQPDPSPEEAEANEVLVAYHAEKEVEKIFQDAIAKVATIPVSDTQPQEELTNALNALKYKTLEDYAKFNNPEDPKNLAVATRDLVNNIIDPAKRTVAVETFQQATDVYAQQFKTSWDWKMILGAVVGAVVGFILGAVIGAAAGPGAIATALAGATTGVVIGATLFGATGAVVGGLIGKQLVTQNNPLEQTTKAAERVSNSL